MKMPVENKCNMPLFPFSVQAKYIVVIHYTLIRNHNFRISPFLKYRFFKSSFPCLFHSPSFPLDLLLASESHVCCNSSFFSCKILNLIAEICHSFLYATWHELMMMNESNKAQIFSVFQTKALVKLLGIISMHLQ